MPECGERLASSSAHPFLSLVQAFPSFCARNPLARLAGWVTPHSFASCRLVR